MAADVHSLLKQRERERAGLHGGAADYESKPRSRFGGIFDRYYIGSADGRDMGSEVPPTNTGADIRH